MRFGETDPVWGDEFIERYLEDAERYSMDNETLHTGFMLALLGQAVGDSSFDIGDNEKHCRVHPFMVQDSGSGKDPAFDYAKKVATFADMNFSDSNDLTNAGLVGTFVDGEEEPGAAEKYDIVGFREAIQLLRSGSSDWNKNIPENINSILDGGHVERHMAAGTIEYRATCTLIGTSYPPTEMDMNLENLMRNGTLARFFYFFRDIPPEFRFRVGDAILERAVEDSNGSNFRSDDVVDTLTEIKNEFHGGKKFSFDYDTERVQRKVRDVIVGNLEKSEVGTRKIVEPSVTRYIEHTLRLGCLMAALDKCSTEVDEEHIDQALEFIELSWTQMLDFFQSYHDEGESSDNSPNARERMVYLLGREGQMTKSEVAEEMDVSDKTVQRSARELETLEMIESLSVGKKRAYKLT
ncbi:hypothetical protein SAMN04488063_1779 [Halopelagius inordinatus]|uniref:Uncharacterized protein n=1 Tax=Halopelagius inordinatus TaxID=553467 RepID=A0A1I2R5T2_9EURY|nr:winged helix-turn-helix domain-containing protein [Halopelagius inordinatus]SFG35403.1 hypothetical protein SAMN04488063_1779 [Halopelagius inordinatus]